MMLPTSDSRHREGIPLSYDGPIIELDNSDGEDDDLGLEEDTVFGEEFLQDPLFSSQGSATQVKSMSGDGGFGGGGERKKKRRVNWGREGAMVTLMETQERGEMMENVDEVNFALDGLRTGQLRVRRASLGSLLRICGTLQRRRLLRANGMVRTITDAILSLSLDDLPSNLTAVTLLYLLTSDAQDDQVLESSRCIRFLIKMLKPVTAVPTENKASKFSLKLLTLRKDPDMSCGSSDKVDRSSTELMSKVREVLVDCKELKEVFSSECGTAVPELSPEWIALMTIEKASSTNLALDESSGVVRKAGGNFKEKLCEFGGLDAIFEVSMHCYALLEDWKEQRSPYVLDDKHDKCLSSMVLLLRCLRIMENATFMSKENQIHLLQMRRRRNSKGVALSFTKLIVNLIRILSGLYLLNRIRPSSGNNKVKTYEGPLDPFEFSSISDREDSCDDFVSKAVEQCCSLGSKPFEKNIELPDDGRCRLDIRSRYSSSSSERATSSRDGVSSSKIRSDSSMNSQRDASKHTNRSCSKSTTSCLDNPVSNGKKHAVGMYLMLDSDGSQDPFAFDADEVQPSKWDLLYGKKKPVKSKSSRLTLRNTDIVCQLNPRPTRDSDDEEYTHGELENVNTRQSPEASCSGSISEGNITLVTDCLLSSVKVLMNLTNDNPLGCKQIAACQGIETVVSLIASHFPVFYSAPKRSLEPKEKNPSVELSFQSDKDLSDRELNLLVAILGLLVNLVEKDGSNRARLAKTKVRRHDLEGLDDESGMDVIPLLCSIFMASVDSGETAKDEKALTWDDEAAMLQGEKEAEKMILEAYSALLLAFLSTESKSVRDGIAAHLPQGKLATLVPVLERFVAFHVSLDMMTAETHKTVREVIESCRVS